MEYFNVITPISLLEPTYLSGNIPVIRIPSAVAMDLEIIFEIAGTEEITLTERYESLDGEYVYLALKDLVHRELNSSLEIMQLGTPVPHVYVYDQKEAYGKITILESETELASFYVVKGTLGIDKFVNSDQFFIRNLLTVAPQVRYVNANEPIFINYYSEEAYNFKARVYQIKDGPGYTTSDLVLITKPYALHTIRTSWNDLVALFDLHDTTDPIVFFEIFAQNLYTVGKRSYPLRFMLKEVTEHDTEFYAFENSLGGIDSISFAGPKIERTLHEFPRAVNYDFIREYLTIPKTVFEKKTGFTESEENKKWVADFFASHRRYEVFQNEYISIVIEEYSDPRVKNEIVEFYFKYMRSRQSTGQIPTRQEYIPLPTNLPETVVITEDDYVAIYSIEYGHVIGGEGFIKVRAVTNRGNLVYTLRPAYTPGTLQTNGSGDFVITNAGDYRVQVSSDDPGILTVKDTGPIALLLIPPIVIGEIIVVHIDVGVSDGEIRVSATGGHGTLNYTLKPGNIYNETGIFAIKEAGLYKVVVNDNYGSDQAETADITVSIIV